MKRQEAKTKGKGRPTLWASAIFRGLMACSLVASSVSLAQGGEPKEPLNNAPQIRDTTRLMLRGDPCN